MATRLEELFERRTDGALRSIVRYEPECFTVVYLRDDVAGQYAEHEIATVVDDSRMESLTAPIYDDLFSSDHGELTCMVKAFENVIEMNFVREDGEGVAVALDDEALTETSGLVADARDIVLDARP